MTPRLRAVSDARSVPLTHIRRIAQLHRQIWSCLHPSRRNPHTSLNPKVYTWLHKPRTKLTPIRRYFLSA